MVCDNGMRSYNDIKLYDLRTLPEKYSKITIDNNEGYFFITLRLKMELVVSILKKIIRNMTILAAVSAAALSVSIRYSDPYMPVTINVDDDTYQEYNGRLGRWMPIINKDSLSEYATRFMSPLQEVIALNGGHPANMRYAFIPYGLSYVDTLEKVGLKRETMKVLARGFIWPVGGRIIISSGLGFRSGEFHPGIDIPAERGSIVRAAMDGEVVFSQFDGGYGNVIDIKHRDSLMTRYGHNTVLFVSKGEYVKKGQIIALAGSTGNSTGSHVHFEIRYNTVPLNPVEFLPVVKNVVPEMNQPAIAKK